MPLPRKFRLARQRDAAQRGYEVDAELRFHLAERIEELVASGFARHEAERVARERFGDVASVRAELEGIDASIDRRRSQSERLASLLHQGRLAVRALVRRPSFSLVAVITLGVGCAAVTAAFTLVDTVLLRPLPFRDPGALVMISHTAVLQGKAMEMDQSDAGFLTYRQHSRVFEAMGAYRSRDVNVALPSRGSGAGIDEAERMAAALVSSDLFGALGIVPARGRLFLDGEDRDGAAPVVVISEALWRRKFGSDPSAVGQRLVVHGVAREIVGIAPSGFAFPTPQTQLWIPASFSRSAASPGSFEWRHIARLRGGVTPAQATRELERLLPRVVEEFPGQVSPAMWAQAHVGAVVRPLRDALVQDVRQLLWFLLASAAVVLVVACANVAGLFVVRAEDGQHELAVRRALGAGTAAALSQYLAEALVVSAGGGAVGLALAALALQALRRFPEALDIPRLAEVAIDGRVLAFVALVLVACTIAASALPLLRSRGLPLAAVLKEAGRGSIGGARTHRSRSVLVVAQVAMAMLLVTASGLMARSFVRLRNVSPGFDGAQVLTLRVALPGATYPAAEDRARLAVRLADEAARIPGIRQAAITSWIPLSGDREDGAVRVEGREIAPDDIPPVIRRVFATDSLFRAMGIPLVAGRTFTRLDPSRLSDEVIVNEAFARRFWPGERALGKRVRLGLDDRAPWSTVIGVVGDIHLESLQVPAEEAVYVPMLAADPGGRAGVHWTPFAIALVVRTDAVPTSLVRPLQDMVHRIDPSLPTYDERPLADVVAAATARMRLTFVLLGAASLVTLLLGAVGIYGVLAYGVALRRREFGVRMALGARPADVRRVVSRQGVRLATIGIAVGLCVALGTTRLIGGLLYDVSPTDPATLVTTCVALLVVAFLASWLPARQAARLAPTVALRGE